MKIMIAVAVALATITTAPVQAADTSTLTPSEIQAAIDTGAKIKPEKIGQVFSVSGLGWKELTGSLANSFLGGLGGDGAGTLWDQFVMVAYAPSTWIQVHAAAAKTSYKKFDIDDVTPDMRRQVLRVFVRTNKHTPKIVVLRGENGAVVEPTGGEGQPCTELIQFGDKGLGRAIQFEFPLGKLRGAQNEKGEFVLTVQLYGSYASDRSNVGMSDRDFKVEQKHLRKLGL